MFVKALQTMSVPLTSDQCSKMAAALLGQARGETTGGIDLTNRSQLLAFVESLVAGESSEDSDVEHAPAPMASPSVPVESMRAQLESDSDEDDQLPATGCGTQSEEESEEAAIEEMITKAMTSVVSSMQK